MMAPIQEKINKAHSSGYAVC